MLWKNRRKKKGHHLYDSNPTMFTYINAISHFTILYPWLYIIGYLQQNLMNWYLFTWWGSTFSLYSSRSPEKPHLHHLRLRYICLKKFWSISILVLTLGDCSIIKPSSAALSRNDLIPPKEGSCLEMAKDVEADPLRSGASVVVFTVPARGGGGRGWGVGSFFSVKSLITYSRNPPS